MRTDDPATPGNGNFEINLAFTFDRRIDERNFEAPLLDINYGLGERIQLKFEIPYVVHGINGSPTRTGIGNSLTGMKWRFVESKPHEFEVSVYPQLEFNNPTSSVDRGLAERGLRFLLPLEVTKAFGPVDVNVEGGYAIRQYASGEWLAGLVVGHTVSKRIEAMGELYSLREHSNDELTLDFGARYKLLDSLNLLLMAGRSVHGPQDREPQFVGYGGLQFLFSVRRKSKGPSASGNLAASR